MQRKKFRIVFRALLCVLCISIAICVPIISVGNSEVSNNDDEIGLTVLNVWQIDNFEGGKGSRTTYLQKIGNKFSKNNECYIVVTALSADAAKLNLDMGNIPDLISYGAGICGISDYLHGDEIIWCQGGYCYLTTDDSADFSDISAENTVINNGTGNYAEITAILSGIGEATVQKPTEAYVNLINKKFKYLLGTQRDVYRLKTRGENFKIKAIDAFNDLYQNISILTTDKSKIIYAKKFVEEILNNSDEINSLGLMVEGKSLHDDEVELLEGINYNYTLRKAITESQKTDLENAIQNHDENKLKILLN